MHHANNLRVSIHLERAGPRRIPRAFPRRAQLNLQPSAQRNPPLHRATNKLCEGVVRTRNILVRQDDAYGRQFARGSQARETDVRRPSRAENGTSKTRSEFSRGAGWRLCTITETSRGHAHEDSLTARSG